MHTNEGPGYEIIRKGEMGCTQGMHERKKNVLVALLMCSIYSLKDQKK